MALESVLSTKLLQSRNFIDNKLKAKRNTQTPAKLNIVGHRVNSLPGHEHLAEEVD